jgi:hypothetical protein
MALETLVVNSSADPNFRLRAIDGGDLEELRTWKNANKGSFFLRSDITPEQQSNWFDSFSQRHDDHMFVVEQQTPTGWEKIGCMGYRLLEDEGCVDGYNIIRSRRIEPASFTMSDAFRLMLAQAAGKYPGFPLKLKVLTGNPAVAWYERNGFRITERSDDHVEMELEAGSIDDVQVIINY